MYSPENPQTRIEKYPGIILGKHPTKDEFLTAYGQSFVDLAAPPGSGKTVGFVIPNLLSYPDSMIVNDPKFECWEVTAGFRAAAGHKVYRFSPERLETHRWNPLSTISRDPLYRLGDIRTIASSLYVSDNPKNQEWYNKAATAFTAIVLYLMETPEIPCTLPQVYEISSLGQGMGAWAKQVIADREASNNPLSAECTRELNSLYEQSKAKSGGWGTVSDIVREALVMYGEKTVAWAVSGDDIQFSKMREEKTTVYFCVSEHQMQKYSGLMALFYAHAIRQNAMGQPEKGGHCPDGSLRLKYQVFVLMDEFAVMGRIQIMETAPALTRGAGLRFGIIYQNRPQLSADDCYGNKAEGILKAFHIQIVYTPNDTDEAKKYSERLGNTTVKVDSGGTSQGEKRTHNTGWSYQARPLMLPQEIIELPYGEQLMFVAGTKKTQPLQIRARKISWYEEPVFKERANWPTPSVPVGNADLIDSLTVPVRIAEPTVALTAPGEQAIRKAQEQRLQAAAGTTGTGSPT